MVTNGNPTEIKGVNPNRTPGLTVPGVTLEGDNSVDKLLPCNECIKYSCTYGWTGDCSPLIMRSLSVRRAF